MDVEIEIEDDYEVPQANIPEVGESFFYKLIIAALLFATYFLFQRFSAAIGARVARQTIAANERDYDEEIREARRRLQERFDAERKKREKEKEEDPSTSISNDLNLQTGTQNKTKRVKPPKAELLMDSGEYFPLMGDSGGSSSRVCFRRSRNIGG
ncbi:unnamed protein product [Rodentolepis nana]|uniref:Selenoprotein S n=1 Tax=Rodentolepis nana TaxID=102285 RepID=A0A0R3TUQ0_RODNA|nr:unnamed protein product [Rodentolepis nana]